LSWSVFNADEVGLAADDIQDYDFAYQERFCFELEETEWLLGTSDRWMRPSNLNISGAEAKSEAKLQEHNRRPWVVKARSRTFQAEYNRTFSLI
jgi:hypothetical protein